MRSSDFLLQTCGDTYKNKSLLPSHFVAALFYLILDNRIKIVGESQDINVEKERVAFKFNPTAFLGYFIKHVTNTESQQKLFQGANIKIENASSANRL